MLNGSSFVLLASVVDLKEGIHLAEQLGAPVEFALDYLNME